MKNLFKQIWKKLKKNSQGMITEICSFDALTVFC